MADVPRRPRTEDPARDVLGGSTGGAGGGPLNDVLVGSLGPGPDDDEGDQLTPAEEDASEREPTQPGGVGPRRFRQVLGHFPAGVTVVTASSDAGPVGLSIGSFTSVSLDPPLIGFLPARRSWSWPRIRAAGRFCVNVLGADQAHLARQFASPRKDRFGDVPWRPAPFSGAPLLDGVIAWIDCALESTAPAGDHLFVLGRVHDLDATGGNPLVFFRGSYRALGP